MAKTGATERHREGEFWKVCSVLLQSKQRMRAWKELGVVETIYEEEESQEEDIEEEEYGSNSHSLTPSLSTTPTPLSSSPSLLSPPPSLRSRVEEWTTATGCEMDVILRVHDLCFNIHKEPAVARSRYLRRRLTESSDITVNPPSNITADTVSEILGFCYDSVINLTPSNAAAITVAAEWLEMEDGGNGNEDGNLMWQTEAYFRHEIAGNSENAAHVLRTCLTFLPGAATLAVRCVEVLASGDRVDGDWTEALTALRPDEFQMIAEAMPTWFARDHDLLYRIVDFYLEANNKKLTEEQKSSICHTINCTKLSHHLLLHLVQNPRLPLRFVVQAMLVDQLHTRHSFLHLSTPTTTKTPSTFPAPAAGSLTLGAILQRDAVLRQASHIRASMEATAFRIESLERDLDGLRRRLRWSEEKKAEMDSARSASFRVVIRPDVDDEVEVVDNKSCRGGTSSVLRPSEGKKGFGRRLVDGLKSVFRVAPSAKDRGGGGEEERRQGHRRNNSFG